MGYRNSLSKSVQNTGEFSNGGIVAACSSWPFVIFFFTRPSLPSNDCAILTRLSNQALVRRGVGGQLLGGEESPTGRPAEQTSAYGGRPTFFLPMSLLSSLQYVCWVGAPVLVKVGFSDRSLFYGQCDSLNSGLSSAERRGCLRGGQPSG